MGFNTFSAKRRRVRSIKIAIQRRIARCRIKPTIAPHSYGSLTAGLPFGNFLQGVDADRTACLVEGVTMQGWSTMGWVACNRLCFSESFGVR